MKRILVAIFAVFYMASATETNVHLHYCMGQLVSTSLIHYDEDHFCSSCGMEKKSNKNGCCKDETKQFKNGGEQIKTSPATFNSICVEFAIIPACTLISYSEPNYQASNLTPALAHAPPLFRHNCPIYLEIRNIRV